MGSALSPRVREQIVRFDPDQWAERGFQVLGWVDYINQLRGDGPAPSWWTSSSYCTIAYQSWSLNEPLLSPAQPTVLDARTCKPGGGTQNLVWNGNSKANELRLRSDLTIIANNFYNTGNLKVQSVDANGNPFPFKPGQTWIEVLGANPKIEKQDAATRFTFLKDW